MVPELLEFGSHLEGAPSAGQATGALGSRSGSADELLDQMGLGELKRLLGLVRQQYEPLFVERRKICLAGPVNTGKSSLYNALVGRAAAQAEVSPVPGTTRRSQVGDAEVFWIIDTPGANEAAVGAEGAQAGLERHDEAFAAARQADLMVLVFDAARGIAQDELTIYGELTGLGKPFVVVLNKIDLVGGSQEAVVQSAARNLGLPPDEIIPTSATQGINLNRLLLAMVETDPRVLATLAELVPGSRWLLANRTILSACLAAGTANVITSPVEIPFASFVPITAIQVAMVLNLARVFGHRLTMRRARELVLTFGSALLGRTLFYQLVNLVPVAGWVLGTAVAVATTMALGYAAAVWFARGERLSKARVKELSEALTRTLVESFKRAPDKAALRKNIGAAVRDTLRRLEEIAGR